MNNGINESRRSFDEYRGDSLTMLKILCVLGVRRSFVLFNNKQKRRVIWLFRGQLGAGVYFCVGSKDGVEHFTEYHELGIFSIKEMKNAFKSADLEVDYDPKGISGRGLYIGRKSLKVKDV